MSVIITAATSNEPYVCVASDIPGSDQLEEKTTMVFIDTPLPVSTTENPVNWTTTQTSDHGASRIVREFKGKSGTRLDLRIKKIEQKVKT